MTMIESPFANPILLTGANGRLGKILRPNLLARYGALISTDINPLEGGVYPGEQFHRADLADAGDIGALVAQAGAVIHFGGIPREAPFAAILATNIQGTYNVFEAARRHGVHRIVYASSNHAMGFSPIDEVLTPITPPRPDSLYGVSKLFGESLARLYVDKHQMQIACLRIGSCLPVPTIPRHLGTWLSVGDLCRLVDACLLAPALHFEILYGVSANSRACWVNATDGAVPYVPQDNAQDYAESLLAHPCPPDKAGHLHGGGMCLRTDWRE